MAMRSHSKMLALCTCAALLLSSSAFSIDDTDDTNTMRVGKSPVFLETALLSDSLDAYFPLAVEIADREGLQLEVEIEKAIDLDPAFLLYVISPQALTERALAELGIMTRNRGAPVLVGFITGSTMESAKLLYERRFSYSGEHAYIDGPGKMIKRFSGDSTAISPPDSINLRLALRSASYLCFSGHGGGTYWRMGDEMFLTARDLGDLPPLIVSSGGCQTFRLWDEASIALAFTDLGAAAYAGFAFSPAPYYHFGFPDGFPLRLTHPGFPVGVVLALQNLGSLQSYARFPFYFMLGDPRICFERCEPYRLVEDRISGDERLIRYEGAPKGFVPVTIVGGAAYPFLEVEGVAKAGVGDLFYSSKIQFLDFRGDRYLLFDHAGGDFAIRLRSRGPSMRPAREAMIDALDHAFVFIPTTGGILFLLIVASSVLFVTVVHTVRSAGRVRGFRAALAAGSCVAIWRGLYALLRAGRTSIVSAPVAMEPRFIVASFILAGCGAFLYLNVHSRLWKTGSILVMTFPAWAVAFFWAAGITYVNLLGAVPHIGIPIYSYTLSVLPAAAFVVECLAVLSLLRILSRITGAGS